MVQPQNLSWLSPVLCLVILGQRVLGSPSISPQTKFAKENGEITIYCTVASSEPPNMFGWIPPWHSVPCSQDCLWDTYNPPCKDRDTYRIKCEDDQQNPTNVSLTITSVNQVDLGNWKCEYGAKGTDSRNITFAQATNGTCKQCVDSSLVKYVCTSGEGRPAPKVDCKVEPELKGKPTIPVSQSTSNLDGSGTRTATYEFDLIGTYVISCTQSQEGGEGPVEIFKDSFVVSGASGQLSDGKIAGIVIGILAIFIGVIIIGRCSCIAYEKRSQQHKAASL